jgi:integrase/recombinase XerD
MNDWDLYDGQGNRKYLISEEREKYFDAIPEVLNREQRTFALMLYYTGCRISEALAVQHNRIDYSR